MNTHNPNMDMDRDRDRDRESIERLMMAVIDGEASPLEEKQFFDRIEQDPQMKLEYHELKSMKEATMKSRLTEPGGALWDNYWQNTYTRLERGFGWILVTLGATILILYGLWVASEAWLTDPGIPIWVRGAGVLLATGTIVLLISVIREKLFLHKNERYKDIQR